MKNWLNAFIGSCILLLVACTPNNVQKDEKLADLFKAAGVEGSFCVYDNGTGLFTVHNLSRYKDSAYLPASTADIIIALIGVETGKLTNEQMKMNGDSITANAAFVSSQIPYYQQLARSIGKDTLKRWIDSLHYGNKSQALSVDSFWLNNTLKITADEQLGLVKKLYFGQLPFQKRTHDIVKKMMLQEVNANYKLSYKTGWGFLPNGKSLGWVVGWIEENKHPYFFVLNLEGDKTLDMLTVRKNLLMNILKEQGFLLGKR
ncbi:MAG: class D beta-lactamase [Chitinophagaceae bacterium]|nr:class D beta-lactamase [Chitinophagaceae bacterium]